jgi:hypothetical protein
MDEVSSNFAWHAGLQLRRVLPLLICAIFLASAPTARAAQGDKKADQPELRIPLQSLGYLPPGTMPSLNGFAAASLHFIDANRLLLAFRIPALLRRGDECTTLNSQREVRAVVLGLPSGKLEKSANWTLYDFGDFLWGLGNGRFLMRRCNRFYLTDASLVLKPFIDVSGSILGFGLSPDHSMAVVQQEEADDQTESRRNPNSPQPQARRVGVEFIRLSPLAVVARATIPAPGEIPILHDGILAAVAAPHDRWAVRFTPYKGEEHEIVAVRSRCMPRLTPLNDSVFSVEICGQGGESEFDGYDRQGALLWKISSGPTLMVPRFLIASAGNRFAIETLDMDELGMSSESRKGNGIGAETIRVFDTLRGKLLRKLVVWPIYTAGQNAAFSPDGNRLAVVRDGAIEIYGVGNLKKKR